MNKNNNLPRDRYYIAYGSNLNLEQMARRSPTAKAIQTTYLQGYRLMFRGRNSAVATIEKHKGCKAPVLVWQLQPGDEHSLDIYEGYPNLYRKEMLCVTLNGRELPVMAYIMNEGLHPYGKPSDSYYRTILDGYISSGFNPAILRQAVQDSICGTRGGQCQEGGDIYGGNH